MRRANWEEIVTIYADERIPQDLYPVLRLRVVDGVGFIMPTHVYFNIEGQSTCAKFQVFGPKKDNRYDQKASFGVKTLGIKAAYKAACDHRHHEFFRLQDELERLFGSKVRSNTGHSGIHYSHKEGSFHVRVGDLHQKTFTLKVHGDGFEASYANALDAALKYRDSVFKDRKALIASMRNGTRKWTQPVELL